MLDTITGVRRWITFPQTENLYRVGESSWVEHLARARGKKDIGCCIWQKRERGIQRRRKRSEREM